MDTITVARTDYIERHEGGHAFYARRTVGAAANLWIAQDPEHRGVIAIGQRITFAYPGSHGITFNVADPDEDMDDLYPAGDLPFAIAASPVAPGDVIVHNVQGEMMKVTSIGPLGHVHGDDVTGAGHSTIHPYYIEDWYIARDTAPTGTPNTAERTFVVTFTGRSDAFLTGWAGSTSQHATVREAR